MGEKTDNSEMIQDLNETLPSQTETISHTRGDIKSVKTDALFPLVSLFSCKEE